MRGASSSTCAAACHLAVEGAQGIGVDALGTLAAQLRAAAPQVLAQQLDVGRTAGGVAHAVDQQAQRSQTELGVELAQHGDDLRVDHGRGRAERLGAELVVLAVAARLRLLVAEHRAVVPELHRLRPLVHAVLHVGAADGRRALRPQRERTARPCRRTCTSPCARCRSTRPPRARRARSLRTPA